MLEIDRPSMKERRVGDLEFTLFASLNPVEPDPEFLTRVRSHIDKRPSMILESRTVWETYVIVASGLFMGVVLLWLVQRRRK